jgi:hypothetical protein
MSAQPPPRATRHPRPAWAAVLGLASLVGCGEPGGNELFGSSPSGGSGGAGGAGGATASSSQATTTTGAATTTSTTGATSTSTTTASSSSTGMDLCGNGMCDPGEDVSCPGDCAAPCAHEVCATGVALDLACDPCVQMVCNADPFCCSDQWDGQCIDQAENLCGAMCCGDGVCSGEDCGSCPADCGACVCGDGKCEGENCVTCDADCGACICGDGTCLGEDCTGCPSDCGPCPDCPHTVCKVGEALDASVCRDPCVDEICAADAACCGNAYSFDGACAYDASMTCGGEPCIALVCAQDASCCNGAWTQACVDLAKSACNLTCACSHDPRQAGGGPLAPGCDPCVDAVCAADPYCCTTDWDTICVDEVDVVCGVPCP